MGIKPTFGNGAVTNQTAAFQKRFEKAIIFTLQSLGESLVSYAEDNHNYTDRTGNLTNSIGYVVVQNKEVIINGIKQYGEAGSAAYKIAIKLASETSATFSLIIVAGMNYAAYVEAKGYNVILPAELKSKTDFPATMQRLMKMAKSKANGMF